MTNVSVGMPAVDFVVGLVRSKKEIESIDFVSYPVAPSFEVRLSKNDELHRESEIESLLAVIRKSKAPLWAILASYYLQTRGVEGLAREALLHDNTGATTWTIPRRELSVEGLEEIVDDLGSAYALSASSKVTLSDGSIGHLPMIDFRCEPSDDNLRAVTDVARAIGERSGAFLNSGNSYHYYGLNVLGERDWVAFLGKCLLFAPLVDVRYIGHRLIDGHCRLRLSRIGAKPVPTVVEVFFADGGSGE
jgi:hypothetical protein